MKRTKPLPPMLVMRAIVNNEMETKELVAVRAFQWGVANKMHYDTLLDMTNMLLVAGHTSAEREYAIKYVDDIALSVMKSIKERYDKTGGKFGVSATELKVLLGLVEFSKQFWNRCPIELFKRCGDELQAYYQSLEDENQIEYKVAA